LNPNHLLDTVVEFTANSSLMQFSAG